MSGLARALFSLRWIAAPIVALAGCQSILGIDSSRPLIPDELSDGGDGGGQTQHDGAPPPPDEGGGDSATSDGQAAVDATDSSIVVDAAEASAPDTGTDGPPATSFNNPVQIDLSALFNANSVATTAVGGVALTAMDGNGASDSNDFPTVSKAAALGSSRGLPDDGFFPGDGVTVPNVQLAWRDSSNVENSIVVSSTLGPAATFTLDVPPQRYSQVQIYATGGGGASTLNYTLTYTDNSATPYTLSLPDWCTGTPGKGQYQLGGSVDRVQNNGTMLNASLIACQIYALNLNPDTGKALKSVTFYDTSTVSTTYLVFYGATAW